MDKDIFIGNVITIANIETLVKETIKKVGLEYMAPLDPAIADEKISKAINSELINIQ